MAYRQSNSLYIIYIIYIIWMRVLCWLCALGLVMVYNIILFHLGIGSEVLLLYSYCVFQFSDGWIEEEYSVVSFHRVYVESNPVTFAPFADKAGYILSSHPRRHASMVLWKRGKQQKEYTLKVSLPTVTNTIHRDMTCATVWILFNIIPYVPYIHNIIHR